MARLDLDAMFFFRHPKPVVDRRPVAEHSVQVEAKDLPVLVELRELPRRRALPTLQERSRRSPIEGPPDTEADGESP